MSATSSEKHVALYSVLVDGQEVDEQLGRRIREVRVLNYLRLPDVCTFTASFPKGEEGQPEPIDQQPFQIGSKLEIRLGAREELTTRPRCSRARSSRSSRTSGAGGVELTGPRLRPARTCCMRARNSRTFQNQTSSDIVTKLVQDAGFTAECDPSGDPHEFMQQDNETDWDFIWRLADRAASSSSWGAGRPTSASPHPTARSTSNGRRAALVHPPRHRRAAGQEVTLLAQDPMTKQAINVSASSTESDRPDRARSCDGGGSVRRGDGAHRERAVKSQSEGQAVAQALLDLLANAYVAAEGVTTATRGSGQARR